MRELWAVARRGNDGEWDIIDYTANAKKQNAIKIFMQEHRSNAKKEMREWEFWNRGYGFRVIQVKIVPYS